MEQDMAHVQALLGMSMPTLDFKSMQVSYLHRQCCPVTVFITTGTKWLSDITQTNAFVVDVMALPIATVWTWASGRDLSQAKYRIWLYCSAPKTSRGLQTW